MGVFKWLRRERVTVTRHSLQPPSPPEDVHQVPLATSPHVGTIRTEEYKRDLAEFQARRSLGNEDTATPDKKRSSRHSIPISCTACTDHDRSFNYEKKSAIKYKKKSQRRRSTSEEGNNALPNIQFLFQNQVFMPGNIFSGASYSEPPITKLRCRRRVFKSPEKEISQKLSFHDDKVDSPVSPPLFYKNNALPVDIQNFLNAKDREEVDGHEKKVDQKSSQSSSASPRKEDSGDEKLWEVMSELNHFDKWADEQLYTQIPNNTRKSEDSNKSDASAYGLPIVSSSSLDVSVDVSKTWNSGKWGVIPVQIKRLAEVTMEQVRRRQNVEVNILRKCRHPNIILLMGLFTDVHRNVHIICERCVDSLYGILHIQGRFLSVQTSVHYALDIANALVFLRMRGYIHSGINSLAIMITSHDAAKLSDLSTCVRPPEKQDNSPKIYSLEPQYINIDDTHGSSTPERQPLLSQHPSETYLTNCSVSKPYSVYENCEHYRWLAPELFPADDREVQVCSKSDVYSLCLVLWESCNAMIPWNSLTYDKLKELYTLWNTGVQLPQDGTYPGSLLSLLQSGLNLNRLERMDLHDLQRSLHNAKSDLDDIEYIVIPASKKKSNFTSAWDSTPSESDSLSPRNIKHKVDIHSNRNTSTESDKESNCRSPLYDTIRKSNDAIYAIPDKFLNEDGDRPTMTYDKLVEKDYSSACSTPLAKMRTRMKDVVTPGTLHRSDSTEYCSILSPANHTVFNETYEKPIAKLSRSFTPKSYKSLHISVPECKSTLKPLITNNSGCEKSSYKFDIQNYSLPTTPIARSNKLRRNAWLSGDIHLMGRFSDTLNKSERIIDTKTSQSAPETPAHSLHSSCEKDEASSLKENASPDNSRDLITGLRKTEHPQDFSSPEIDEFVRERTSSWSFKSVSDQRSSTKSKVEDDVLANVNVKPLVAIHERWIHEANRKTAKTLSLPDDNRCQIPAMKPASHTLQKSLSQLDTRRPSAGTLYRGPTSPSGKNGYWEQFCQARDNIARSLALNRDPEKRKREYEKGLTVVTQQETHKVERTDQATETLSIEEFIRDLIRKEFQQILQEISDETSSTHSNKTEHIVNRGVANVLNNLRNSDTTDHEKIDSFKSFSKVKINGNNKPLLQITFNRSGENHLHVLDNCVNVTICDNSNGKEKLNESLEDTLIPDEVNTHSLKRCQAFSALQEARSTEDLYIDDDLSTHMQENFGGRVKLIPLHGSLHEILCEKEDECCLIKVKQENGCDTIYFRCDNSDTESKDAIDGHDTTQETVVFKRSFSLVEERIQRIVPKDKRTNTPIMARKVKRNIEPRMRPKSEIFSQKFDNDTRILSSSSPSLIMKDRCEEVEVNIENVMSYQDSSSEECLRCHSDTDDFEILEQKIEEDLANSTVSSLTCGCLEKISEENLSIINEETDKD